MESRIQGIRAMMKELMEQKARQHNELVKLLREVAVSRGCDVSKWDFKEHNKAAFSVGAKDVEDGTKSDREVVNKEPGEETTLVVKPTEEDDISKDGGNPGDVMGSPVIQQNNNNEVVVKSSNRMPRGWLPLTKTIETKNLDQKHVVMDVAFENQKHVARDAAFENQKQQSLEKEFGCKGFGREVHKIVMAGDLRSNDGCNGDCLGSYNSGGVRRLASNYNKGKVHGYDDRINITGDGGSCLVSKSGTCWPIDERSIFYKMLDGEVKCSFKEKFEINCIRVGSRKVHYEDDYPWDPGIKRFKATP